MSYTDNEVHIKMGFKGIIIIQVYFRDEKSLAETHVTSGSNLQIKGLDR